ncbi:hypothetical protein GCK32_006221 [Trichostrongylus colubriformis]|uniref:Uncharacterized protein n=1 Tax=Trichostrongylus colubriformis TaxID=6319 RepID=A0AAN8EUE4_TRICO
MSEDSSEGKTKTKTKSQDDSTGSESSKVQTGKTQKTTRSTMDSVRSKSIQLPTGIARTVPEQTSSSNSLILLHFFTSVIFIICICAYVFVIIRYIGKSNELSAKHNQAAKK